MTLVEVQSSYIRAVGYEAGLMRIYFRDGNVGDYPDVSPEQHAAFMAAESKGRYLHQHFCKGRASGERAAAAPAASEHLNTYAEDRCCNRPLAKVLSEGKLKGIGLWTCPECGCEWRAELVGTVRHWRPHEAILIFKP